MRRFVLMIAATLAAGALGAGTAPTTALAQPALVRAPAGYAPGRWTAVSRIPYQLIISALVVACKEQGGAWLARPA